MPIDTTWTDPSTGGAIDLNTDQILTETIWDKVLSNLKHLGGTLGTIGARVYNTGGQAIANNVSTQLLYANERFDTDAMHDQVTNTGRLTCNTAGIYLITGHVDWETNSNGVREVIIRVNGTTPIAVTARQAALTGTNQQSIATLWRLAVADWMELVVFQTSGVSLLSNATADYGQEFAALRLGV